MKKLMIAFTLCLVSVLAMNAQSRQLSAQFPASTPSIDLVLNQCSYTLQPQTLNVTEKGASQVVVEVKFNQFDKATVTLPIAYDTMLELALRAVNTAHEFHLISDKEYQDCIAVYNKQTQK